MQDNNSSDHSQLEKLPKMANRRGDDNEEQLTTALKRHENDAIPAIFKIGERRLVQEHLVKELSRGFEHRRETLEMVLETRRHSVREACNHVLVTGKTQMRQERLQYFGAIYHQVESSMSTLANNFLVEVDTRFENLSGYKNELIRTKEQKRLENSVEEFLNTLDQLMNEFRSIISENIKTDTDC